MLCFIMTFAVAFAGCSEEDDPTIDNPSGQGGGDGDGNGDGGEEEEVDPPTAFITFGVNGATGIEFDVVGAPQVNGNRYMFNANDQDNGCGQPGGDYIELDTLEAVWQDGFSIAAWVEFKEENRYFERIIDFGNNWGEKNGMNITFSRLARSSDLVLTSWIDSDSLTNREKGRVIARKAIVNNQSTFYAATISPTGEMKIFVNGVMVAEKSAGHPVANVRRTKNYIGHSNWCEEDYDLKGEVDGMYIYNKAITPAEVKAVYKLKAGAN